MSLFRKLFGSKTDHSEEEIKSNERSKYMPEVKLPVDERFTINFKRNGGKFLYCEDLNEIFDALENIIHENQWMNKQVMVIDNNLKDTFKNFEVKMTTSAQDSEFFLTTCENLIADDGSLLISSNQIAEKKLGEFPDHFVVFAATSQIVESISEGLRGIKSKNKRQIPTNITTIKHFKATSSEEDFMTYGSHSKDLYLLLLEDL